MQLEHPWKAALNLNAEMQQRGLVPDIISFLAGGTQNWFGRQISRACLATHERTAKECCKYAQLAASSLAPSSIAQVTAAWWMPAFKTGAVQKYTSDLFQPP